MVDMSRGAHGLVLMVVDGQGVFHVVHGMEPEVVCNNLGLVASLDSWGVQAQCECSLEKNGAKD